MSEHADFLRRSAAIADDPVHRGKLRKAIGNHAVSVRGMMRQQFRDWQVARRQAALVKDYVLSRLPELLEQFEAAITARGATVLWARDMAEAQAHLADLTERHHVRKAIKSKSMISEEIELNPFLEARGIGVLESDLGELIVQLAGEKPYHIVTPAMHRSKEEIARLFHEKLGTPLESSAEELTMAARAHLRQAYVTADMGITGGNFIVAEEGALVLTENEGNARLTMGCPPVHVAIVGIEKVIPSLAELPIFLPLLSTSGTGQQVTCYNSIVRGPRQPGEVDGPEHLYVILLDNGRSRLYARPALRQALRCIRCGSCLNACPVYGTIGGHAYNSTYQGPIGAVITPHLQSMPRWQHLAQPSSLCGACSDACPVNIDLHGLILENRWLADREHGAGWWWRMAMRGWGFTMANRRRLALARRLYRLCMPWMPLPKALKSRVPRLAPKSFARQWRKLESVDQEESTP